jgi:ABC-type Mn2+/Zn2+ transport system ATPase subunit
MDNAATAGHVSDGGGTAAAELLRFENASIGYGGRAILRDLDFSIRSADYLAIVGSNGSGKTTLLRALLGLIKPLGGGIRATTESTLHFGYVPQLQTVDEYFPLTVSEVVLMGRYGRLGALRRPGAADRERAQEALREVGIDHLSTHLYREMSGGQKQRTLIARALASDPDILVLDEHTNDLDIASEKSIMALIDRLHAERGLAIVMVSHSLNTVANHCRNIGIISEGLCRFAPVEDVLQPQYLEELYGVPLRVLEVEGTRVVV